MSTLYSSRATHSHTHTLTHTQQRETERERERERREKNLKWLLLLLSLLFINICAGLLTSAGGTWRAAVDNHRQLDNEICSNWKFNLGIVSLWFGLIGNCYRSVDRFHTHSIIVSFILDQLANFCWEILNNSTGKGSVCWGSNAH